MCEQECIDIMGMSLKWHKHFMARAILVSTCSKDPSTQCGAIIIGEGKTPISDGYNGFPRGMEDDESLYLDREFKYKHILHAEDNAILNACRTGTPVTGSVLYCTHPCCPSCSGRFKQAGGIAVVYNKPSADFISRWPMEESIEHFKRIKLQLYELSINLKRMA